LLGFRCFGITNEAGKF